MNEQPASPSEVIKFFNCPSCSALVQSGVAKCWLCAENLADRATDTNPYQSPLSAPPVETAAGSTVAILGLALSLVVVCIGAGLAMPAVGVGLAIAVFPAFLRTVVVSSRTGPSGMAAGNTIYTFFSALCAVFTAGMAAACAFFATCCAACFGAMSMNNQQFFEWGFLAGGLVGVIIAGVVLHGFWKRPNSAGIRR